MPTRRFAPTDPARLRHDPVQTPRRPSPAPVLTHGEAPARTYVQAPALADLLLTAISEPAPVGPPHRNPSLPTRWAGGRSAPSGAAPVTISPVTICIDVLTDALAVALADEADLRGLW